MNKVDIQKANLKQGDYVDLISHYKGKKRIAPQFVVVAYDLPSKNIATYFPKLMFWYRLINMPKAIHPLPNQS